MPIIDKDQMATFWTRPAFIPGDNGQMHVMFFDEFGHAPVPMQQMAYSLVLDRALGGYKLPKKNRVILASNTREDGGGDNKMLRPLQNRMAHIQVEVDQKGFLEKTREWGWQPQLIAFLQTRPALIYDEDAARKTDDPSFPTPRSLEAFNRSLKAILHDLGVTDSKHKIGMIETCATAICGQGFSRQFVTFFNTLGAAIPRMADILADPEKAKVPASHEHQWVVAGAIAANVETKTAAKYAAYLARLAPDIRAGAAHNAATRDQMLNQSKEWKALQN
jgi:hypothetical protein